MEANGGSLTGEGEAEGVEKSCFSLWNEVFGTDISIADFFFGFVFVTLFFFLLRIFIDTRKVNKYLNKGSCIQFYSECGKR